VSTIRQFFGTIVLVVVVWGQAINGSLIVNLTTRRHRAVALPRMR
jgi:hypothetical protein